MFTKRFIVCALLLFGLAPKLWAQDDDFCHAVSVILRDAPNEFRNVRTNLTQTSVGMKIYKSGVIVPGTIRSRFVFTMGNFYEGALAQSRDLKVIKAAYDLYMKKLENCLKPKGLTMKFNDNFTPGLSEYKKVVYLPTISKNTDLKALKGHVAMEVDYSKTSGLYTLIFYIYQH